MDHFVRHDGVLHAEDVPLPAVADRVGTPTYVYCRATLERHVRVLQQGVAGLDALICYAVKANGNLAILQLLEQLGCGFDAVSGGELERIRKCGVPGARLIVSGVGKRDDEIAAALVAQARYISVESAEELQAVQTVAQRLGVRAAVAIRVNPDVDARTHPYISTGLRKNKFGVPIEAAAQLYAVGQGLSHVRLVGVTCHIGSQIVTLDPFVDAARRLVDLVAVLRAQGVPLAHVGVGGGLGVPYRDEAPPDPARYGAALAEVLHPLGLSVVLEPGRVIVGNAGILLTRVVRRKEGSDRRFVIVDAGMNDLLRPALYSAYHGIEPVRDTAGPLAPVDVVGPVCESADTFAEARPLPAVQPGDLLAIRTAGAYGMAMASTYNGRPRPAEVLCSGAQATVIRQRDTVPDLWRGEAWLDGTPVDSAPAGDVPAAGK